MINAFEIADSVLKQGVESVSELINDHAFMNLDFADIRTVMKDAGYAHMGVGQATGENKAGEAAQMAIQSPLLETSIDQARGVILSFISSPDIALDEVDEAASMVTNSADPDANVIWGISFDTNMVDTMKVTVIATGFDAPVAAQPPKEKSVLNTREEIGVKKDANWFDVNDGKGPMSNEEEDDYLNDVISILKRNSGRN